MFRARFNSLETKDTAEKFGSLVAARKRPSFPAALILSFSPCGSPRHEKSQVGLSSDCLSVYCSGEAEAVTGLHLKICRRIVCNLIQRDLCCFVLPPLLTAFASLVPLPSLSWTTLIGNKFLPYFLIQVSLTVVMVLLLWLPSPSPAKMPLLSPAGSNYE